MEESLPKRGGRPPREQAAQLGEHILDVATELLLTGGYGATSIEAIARRAGVSKRTFYARFADKPALMSAVVVRLIEHLKPPGGAIRIDGATLEERLRALAALIVDAAVSPQALELHRLVVAESKRFPELAVAVERAGGRQLAVEIIGGLLAPLPAAEAQIAAEHFLQMVVSEPRQRALGLGHPMTAAERAAWATQAVAIFLNGYRGAGV